MNFSGFLISKVPHRVKESWCQVETILNVVVTDTPGIQSFQYYNVEKCLCDFVNTHSFSFYFQPISVSIFFLKLGVDSSLTVRVEYKLSFPPEGNSLIPPKLAVQV